MNSNSSKAIMASRKRSLSSDSDIHALHKEWDEASCPICMDHPHNAVLLLCSSHEKGCKSYICDTSYRHSNCLDLFKKPRPDSQNSLLPPNLLPTIEHSSINTYDSNSDSRTASDLTEASGNHTADGSEALLSLGLSEGQEETGNSESLLRCPLCRGTVLGWEVVEEARKYLNMKSRSCSRESCSFSGNYTELRRHARRAHPTARPADTDPSRVRAWRHLEHQRDYGDLVSVIRSAMPGAVVLGDYVIENGDSALGERERGSGGAWWTTFFLFQMIGSRDPVAEPRRSRSRGWSRHRRVLWGENLLGLHNDEDDDGDDEEDLDLNLSDLVGDISPIPRRRRRLTRSTSDEDQS